MSLRISEGGRLGRDTLMPAARLSTSQLLLGRFLRLLVVKPDNYENFRATGPHDAAFQLQAPNT